MIIIILMRGVDSLLNKYDFQNERTIFSCASTKLIHQQNDINENLLEKCEININPALIETELKCYDWRAKTQFPIVKIYDYVQRKANGLYVKLQIRLENYPIRLVQLFEIPLFKMLYLLKESIIGFERLFDRFGSFQITSKMIALSQQHKCKIWLNENFASNEFTTNKKDEREFLSQIYKLFEEKSNKLKNSVAFFQQLGNCKSFCLAFTFIQNYARQNKISIPTSCKINPKQLSTIPNKSNTSNFDPTLTMSRPPKFFNSADLRNSVKGGATRMNFFGSASSKIIAAKQERGFKGQMKASGDTAADIYASNTLSFENNEERYNFDESIIFGPKDPFKKSETNFKAQFNNKQQIKATSQEYIRNAERQSKTQKQIDCEDGEYTSSVNNLFHKNNWQKTLNGLFSGDSNLKESMHHGKEKRSNQMSSVRLELLGSLGKNIKESFIREQHNFPHTSQF